MTALVRVERANGAGQLLEQLRSAHDLGFTVAYVTIPELDPLPALEMLGSDVIPEISTW